MRPVLTKLTPTRGFSSFLHYTLLVLLPLLAFTLIRLEFVLLAFIVIILAKWRMFAVRPRFWPANVRANAVDIMLGLSIVIFMQYASSSAVQLAWAVAYGVWLIVIKPRSSILWITLQAGIAQFAALTAVYVAFSARPTYALSLLAGLICYLAARHFFDSFDEVYARLLSYTWGYFASALTWLSAHWLFTYPPIDIAFPVLLLTIISYSIGTLYYLDHHEKLGRLVRMQVVFGSVALVVLIIGVSLIRGFWGSKVV